MLTIRSQQLELLGRVPLAGWLARMLTSLFPDVVLPDARLKEFVRMSTERGVALGFGAAELPAWVALEFALGDAFHMLPENAWAAEILADRTCPRADAVQRLREQAILQLAAMTESPEETD